MKGELIMAICSEMHIISEWYEFALKFHKTSSPFPANESRYPIKTVSLFYDDVPSYNNDIKKYFWS